jgi:D-3-phosphoglycerate dehydrogenase
MSVENPPVRLLMEPWSRALIVESPHTSLDDYLREIGIEPARLNEVPDEDALIAAIQETGAQILFKRSRVPVTARVIESCPSLHLIQLCCIGDDSIDKEACAKHGVLVCNDPISNGRSVLELAVGHMVALSRRLYETDRQMHESEWHKNNKQRYEIMDKRLGIVGLGNIGRQIARACEYLGMEILFFDNRPVAQEVGLEMGWEFVDTLEGLFAESDIVTVHTSALDFLGNQNTNILDDVLTSLGKNRPENSPRLFLNLARGNLHTTDALKNAIASGAIRRAAVDVYPTEPRPGQTDWRNAYEDEPRVVCTPHIGAATQEAQPRIAKRVSRTVRGLSRFGSLRDCVYAARAELSVATRGLRGRSVLAVVHSTARGTKKAIDDALYQANVNNLRSAHVDFDNGIAYDLSVMDRPLTEEELQELVKNAEELAREPNAIRAVRQLCIPEEGY